MTVFSASKKFYPVYSTVTAVTLSLAFIARAASISACGGMPSGKPSRLASSSVRQRLAQAIAAQQEPVARDQAVAHLVEGELAKFCTDGAGDHVRPRMVLHLVRFDRAGLQQFLHQAVVAGDLAQRAATQQVGAEVARPQAGEVSAACQHDDDGRGHHHVRAAPHRLLAQRRMRPLDRQAHLASNSEARNPAGIASSASAIMPEATSPAAWPPAPSATAQRPRSGRST